MTKEETQRLDDFAKWLMRGMIAALLAITAFFLMRVVERQDTIADTLNKVSRQQAIMGTQLQRLEKDVERNRQRLRNAKTK